MIQNPKDETNVPARATFAKPKLDIRRPATTAEKRQENLPTFLMIHYIQLSHISASIACTLCDQNNCFFSQLSRTWLHLLKQSYCRSCQIYVPCKFRYCDSTTACNRLYWIKVYSYLLLVVTRSFFNDRNSGVCIYYSFINILYITVPDLKNDISWLNMSLKYNPYFL